MSFLTIHVSVEVLDLLEWLGKWKRGEGFDAAKTAGWPPGWRLVPDLSARHGDEDQRAMKELPHARGARRLAHEARANGLAEGSWGGNHRLTPRGAAVLRLAGRPAPAVFPGDGKWHNVPLAPAGATEAELRELARRIDPFTEESTPTVTMTQPNGQTNLWGSGRVHHRWIAFEVRDAQRRHVCEFDMSFEHFADMLSGPHAVPATLGAFRDQDGMFVDAPAPEPVSIRDRMHERMDQAGDDLVRRIDGILSKGRPIPKWLEHELRVLRDVVRPNVVFAATQAEEELSARAETALTVARERIGKMIVEGQPLEPVLLLGAAGADADKNARPPNASTGGQGTKA